MYTYETSVKLHDTDAAGVLFFANYFRLTHEAYENFMASIGFPFFDIIHKADYVVLIVHAECDYKKPLQVGARVTVRISASKIGRTSFTLDYTLTDFERNLVATGNSVHACVTKADLASIPLPDGLKRGLEKIA